MSTTHRILLDVKDSADFYLFYRNLISQDPKSFSILTSYLDSLISGARTGKIRVNIGTSQASGTITFASFVADDTVTINGVVFTGKASPSGAQQWAIGANDEACANNLADKINTSTLSLIGGTVAASRKGTIALSSFVQNDTVTVNGIVFTGKNSPDVSNLLQFGIGSTDALTAENIRLAVQKAGASGIKSVNNVTVSRSTATLTFYYIGSLTLAASAHATVANKIVEIICLIPGYVGNLCTLAISAHGSVSGANLTSGADGYAYILSSNYVTY